MKKLLTLLIVLLSLKASAHQETIVSPNGEIEVRLKIDGTISFTAYNKGVKLFEASNILLVNKPGGEKYKFKIKGVTKNKVDRTLKPEVHLKASEIREYYNEKRIDFKSGLSLTFRVFNEGIAYRFSSDFNEEQTIYWEDLNLSFPENTSCYFPKETSFMSHNERYYEYKRIDEIAEKEFCSLPCLMEMEGGEKVLINESDLIDYAGMWLESTGNGLRAIYPKYPTATKMKRDRDELVTETADYIAKTDGQRDYPWRIFAVADEDSELIHNQMTWLLASPSMIQAPSWIKPGKVAWDWWNANNIYGVDFEAGVNTQTYKYYIDFASDYGIEYIILDEGWYKLGDLLDVVPEIDIPELVAYGKAKGVDIILWVIWKTLDEQLHEALDQFEAWGVKGIKVDFMQRDDQWMVDYYYRISEESAKRKLLVDFHGSYKPAGLHRTWPNVLTREGVRGLEQNKWSDKLTPEHNVTLPFIRMVAGPMDYTPGAMINAAKGNFSDIFNRPMSQGTRCHQLAMYVVYESPLQMLADNPSNYKKEEECMEFLSAVPAVWDETIVIEAKVADHIILARRSGDEWYIGGMTDWEPKETNIKLDFLEDKNYKVIQYMDGVNAHRYGSDYKKLEFESGKNSIIPVIMAPGGGVAIRLVPIKQK